VLQALIEIEREGIKTAVTESKKTSGGYLAAIDLVLDTGVVSIRLEASFREKALKGEVETIASDFMPAYLINVLAQEQLVEGKLSALQHRQNHAISTTSTFYSKKAWSRRSKRPYFVKYYRLYRPQILILAVS